MNQGGHPEDDIQERISRNQTLVTSKSSKPLATGEWIMSQTNVQQGPKLGALKNWLHREQIARNLTDLDQIETLLCTLSWDEDEFGHWPKLQFP